MIRFEGHSYYQDGVVADSTVVGYESSINRVLRMEFTTGASGATGIDIYISEDCIDNRGGKDLTKIPFYITTSDSSHANANEEDGYAVTGYITGSSKEAYSGHADVILLANTKYYIWFFPAQRTYGWSYWYANSSWCWSEYEISGQAVYTLAVVESSGVNAIINRTYSAAKAPTGLISDGQAIYVDDRLKIDFSPEENYELTEGAVNGVKFSSGNTHIVSGNVSVSVSGRICSSSVSATNATIGQASEISVVKHDAKHVHSLRYVFGELSGYISETGDESGSELLMSASSVHFTLPDKFYTQMPSEASALCMIECRTYEMGDGASNAVQVGSVSSCSITVFASFEDSKPMIAVSVSDTNPVTAALTGDSSIIIRHRSDALCEIVVTPQNHASIANVSIDGEVERTDLGDGRVSGSKLFTDADTSSVFFMARDSRGFTNGEMVNLQVVPYIPLTCNPLLTRAASTRNQIYLEISGNFYNGSFGRYQNRLKMHYRWKEAGGDYSDWAEIDAAGAIVYNDSSYKSSAPILIGDSFDYQRDYTIQIKATDGNGDYVLDTVVRETSVSSGVPVFDWGKSNFNINVDLLLKHVNITDIIYPVGVVYCSVNSTLPDVLSGIGTWESIDIGVQGAYTWKRTT